MGLVTFKFINKTYDAKKVLDDIHLTIQEGEFFTLLGPSGCGKTTLLRILAGFVEPDSGQVLFDGKDITAVAAENRQVGMVFQNYALFPFMNVFENIAYGLKINKVKKKMIEAKVRKYLELVNLSGYEKRNISELSGGEQQRVALARALIVEPKVLLLDEPLSNLDARLRDRMRLEIKEIQRTLGITCIFVTHDQKEALTMADRIAVFNEGHCVQVGTPKEIYSNPINTFVAKFIGETNLFEAKINGDEATINTNITLTLSNTSEKKGNYVSIRPQDIMLSTKEISKINTLRGIIRDVVISGDMEEYKLEVEGLEWRVIQLNSLVRLEEIHVGDQVNIVINPKAIHILED